MKKYFLLFIVFINYSLFTKAQTTAMDFNRADCNGNMHHLFTMLDSGDVVIQEFFMTCNSCINAGHAIDAMLTYMNNAHPGKIHFYQIGYNNTYSCSTVMNWQSTNGFTAVPYDSGAALVAYYGGFGMPTISVVAGSNHLVISNSGSNGFMPADTGGVANQVRAFFNGTLSNHAPSPQLNGFHVFPDPAKDHITIEFNVEQKTNVELQLTDISGKLITEIYSAETASGLFRKEQNISAMAPGLYLLKITMNGKSYVQKITVQ